MSKAILPSGAANVVLYLRMSGERQEHSIPAQRAELHAYAERHGYKIVREYRDEAISGDDTKRRAGFLRMREDAATGEFSVVLCWDQDRFGRFDPIEGGHWILPFRDAGVRLETIAQGRIDWNDFAGRLLYLVQQEAKHAYLRDLSRNVSRGLLAGAKDRRTGTGGRSPQGLQNDPERAAIVRRIFADYLQPGASLRSVANGLNRDGLLSPKGKTWTIGTIRYVLRNQKYVGDFVRFRFRAGKYYAVKRGEIVPRTKADKFEEVEPTVVKDHHEGIVDRKAFDAVQAKLELQARDTAPRTGRRYAFSGLLRCGDCGLVMGGQPGRRDPAQSYYRCHTYTDGGKGACYSNSIPEDVLLDCVVRMIEREYLSDEALDRLRAKLRQRQAAQNQGDTSSAGSLRKRIKDLDRQIDQGAERVLSAPEKLVATIYAKLDQLREERDRAEAQLAGLTSHTSLSSRGAKGTDAEVEAAIGALKDLRQTIRKAGAEERRELLRRLVVKVEIRFSHRQRGSKMENTVEGGTIFVRPGENVAGLVQKSREFCTRVRRIEFTAADLVLAVAG